MIRTHDYPMANSRHLLRKVITCAKLYRLLAAQQTIPEARDAFKSLEADELTSLKQAWPFRHGWNWQYARESPRDREIRRKGIAAVLRLDRSV